ncbi:ABC transporter ATP-binding protein [uncultured Salinisphaera sp.]|uniref:ABC transporter ATP-binding protein n=1 Tax=uncultured Salinisphaera sp. TaxID=359372 RepID=UPI0032B243C3|tara:strand:- start:282 stop:1091 length:810 start_codon:yes stop_codon:yes gene_type:complete
MSKSIHHGDPLARLSGVRLAKAGHSVLDGVTLDVFAGELLAVVGPNGAGKSSALKCLGGIETDWQGHIELAGSALEGFASAERARQIAYLPQIFAPHWELSVADLLEIGLQRGRPTLGWRPWAGPRQTTAELLAQRTRLLDDLELSGFLERRFASLSGGERARALLAQALVTQPNLLLADEPIASLDPAHQLRTMQYLRRCRDRTASVVVLHDLNLALRFADRIAVMAHGRVVACGTTAHIVASDILAHVFDVRFEAHTTCWGEALLAS